MKKLLQSLFILVFIAGAAMAQERTITGKVTAKEDGNPLPGVTVKIKNLRSGTQTASDGRFSLQVPAGSTTLEFSYLGYVAKAVNIGASSVLNVVLEADNEVLSEVVVTALGIKREAKALGYSTTTVKADELTAGRSGNIVNSLAGKVAGVKILSSGGAVGAPANINIRQATTFTGSNQPIFVVDGIPIDNQSNTGGSMSVNTGSTMSNRAIDLNQDDIESVTILKGPSAAMLYGSRAAAGAVLVTTKKGAKGQAGRVEVSSNYNIINNNRYADYQNTYAQGNAGNYNAFSNNSWGPKIVGQEVTNYLGNKEILTAYPDNVKDLFKQGYSLQNNLTFSGGTDKNTYYISYGNFGEKGYLDNNSLYKNNFTFNGSSELNKKLVASVSAQYIHSNSTNTQVANQRANPLFDAIAWPRNYNPANYPFERPDGSNFTPPSQVPNPNYTYWNSAGTDNPLWSIKNNPFKQEINRVIANLAFDYKILDWLSASYKIGVDNWTNVSKLINAKGTNNNQSANRAGSIIDNTTNRTEISSYLNLTATRKLSEDFGLRVLLGNEVNYRNLNQNQVRGNGIQDPKNFNIANTLTYIPFNSISEQSLIGFYADISLDYKQFAYLTFTGRNDISSTFAQGKNSYFYPSVSGSLVLTEAFPSLREGGILSYAKVNGNIAKIGREASLYNTATYFGTAGPSDGFGPNMIFPFNNVAGQTYNDGAGNADIGPEFTTNRELGLQAKFLKNRISLDFTYYSTLSTDVIFSVPKAPSSGFGSILSNAGKLKTSGVEFLLSGIPVQTKNFSWDIAVNWTRGRSKVIQLAPGVPFIGNGGFTNPQGRIVEGLQFGTLFGQVFNKINGKDVVDANGRLTGFNTQLQVIGDPNPQWTAGITNTINYKGFSLSALLDIRYGGDVYSRTVTDLRRFGAVEETGNRDRLYVHNAVNANGTPNTTLITAEQYYADLFSASAQEYAVFDASWIRLREVALSYKIPGTVFRGAPFIKGINVGLNGRNIFMYAPNVPHIDPENNLLGVSNGQGIEYNGQPQTRSFGASLRVTF
ncbi:SusC/RagA family TonB-linked outer membrane protein [Pedobacter caeni]|uniref:TonB-linked outer membrane protein, SusC/RagA family n=1 Tax=Pedobacter caeni TaxID=288992 RepID=A0A1M5MQM4_9SPHI|nr:SusC/RagA family TonB-linked outer membrane protein [Pedobacter caeni]SHG79372.1 TonB-linked outer membrane protein, SusC/RagA family [Pedobacter caeni]